MQQRGITMNIKTTIIIFRKSAFFWVTIVTGVILLIPLTAMQLTDEVNWDITDFTVMGFLLFSMGSLFVLISRRVHRKHRVVIGIILAIALLYIWAELAVGIFTELGS
jgi:Ca2+/Na+ antiporter